ncbi:MAG: magnesium/cobalt transporter CorA [Saprospiraceae bacterium]|nr:magnesium/cobalt transporter CorA [Saprospiraceae bacterium]MDW8229167.1 magnesium/cobalt transporter CorA [Saprospiraceae bacterium]
MSKRRLKKSRKKGLPPGTLVYTGEYTSVRVSVHATRYNEAECLEQHRYSTEWRPDPTHVLWVDVRGLTDTGLVERIGADLGLHALALEDVLNTHQRPKMEEYDQTLLFIVHNLRYDVGSSELLSEQIGVFLGRRFVVSFQEHPDDTFQTVRERIRKGAGRLRRKGPDYLAYSLLDTVVDNYYTVLDDLESGLAELEDQIYQPSTTNHLKARIFNIKRALTHFRRFLMPLRDAALRLYRTESDLIDDASRLYLRDLADHVVQILDGADNCREILAGIEALYQAEISNRLNNIMRLLTIISTIFIPLSFVAGIYGMNFDHMPELRWHYGYFAVLGFMALAAGGMLFYFHRKRWL